MLQSRHWIEAASDAVAGGNVAFGDGAVPPDRCAHVTLSAHQVDRLDRLAAASGLEAQVVLSRLIDAALASPDRFDRFDRQRLRRCIDILRAIEVHVARAARSVALRRLSPELTARRIDELLDLGRYLRRVGSVLLPPLGAPTATEAEQAESRDRHEWLLRDLVDRDPR